MKFKYLRKYFFESNKKFEKRVNTKLELFNSKEIIQVTVTSNYAMIAYKEKINNIKPIVKVKGFGE